MNTKPDSIFFHDNNPPEKPYSSLDNAMFTPDCCKKPFVSYNVLSQKLYCMNCKRYYQILRKYKCPKCEDIREKITHLNLIKEDRSDWMKCEKCDKIFTIDKIISIFETIFY
jgi:uncharacterized protein YbaR (Trm112 family)